VGKVISTKGANKDAIRLLRTECEIQRRLSHPHLVRMHGIYESPEAVIIVMDVLKGQELFDVICDRGCFDEPDAAKTIKQLIIALQYMADNNMAHRDLKPENIVYAEDSRDAALLITDFGLAKALEDKAPGNLMFTPCGTPCYVAPEVLAQKQRGYSIECDMWSIGVIGYVLLCGYLPFDEDPPLLYDLIRNADYDMPSGEWGRISADGKDFVNRLLTSDPGDRLSPTQALNHTWLRSVQVDTPQRPQTTQSRIVLQNKKLQRQAGFKLGGEIDQVAGHAGGFVRLNDKTIGKCHAEDEQQAFANIKQGDKAILKHFPNCAGLTEVDGEWCLQLEDIQADFKKASSTMLDVKIGFQTFQADGDGVTTPKAKYYEKAVKWYNEKLSAAEHAAKKISKARWMSLNNQVSSTAVSGFRIDGARVGTEILPLDVNKKTDSVLSGIVIRSNASSDMLRKIVAAIETIRDNLEKSSFFMSHSLYGASLLIIFDTSGKLAVKIIDIGKLIPRDGPINRDGHGWHRVKPTELPLACESTQDGFLSGLDSLVDFFGQMIYQVDMSGHIPRGTQFQLGGPVDQVAGHPGSFIRTSPNTVCKTFDAIEHAAYLKISAEAEVKDLFARFVGVKDVDKSKYIEIEDVQKGMSKESSTLLDIKIGFHTFNPAAPNIEEAQENYFKKASRRYSDLLTAEETAAGRISKGRWMRLNNEASSTAKYGFRIDGSRTASTIVPLEPEEKTLAAMNAALTLAKASGGIMQKLVEAVENIRAKLAKSKFFETHELFGASILIAFNSDGNVTAKIVDLRGLTQRDYTVKHTATDGFYTALDNLAACFRMH